MALMVPGGHRLRSRRSRTDRGLPDSGSKTGKTVTINESDRLFGPGGPSRGIVGVLNAAMSGTVPRPTCAAGRRTRAAFGAAIMTAGMATSSPTGDLRTSLAVHAVINWSAAGPEGYRSPRFDKTAERSARRGGRRGWPRDGPASSADGIGDRRARRARRRSATARATCWEPLLAVADAAGGDRPVRARQACTRFGVRSPPVNEEDDQEDEYRDALSAWAAERCGFAR